MSTMKKYIFLGTIAFAIAISALILQMQGFESAEETITFFPLDQSVQYKDANTTLTLQEKKVNNQHRVEWKVSSQLDREAYLRQDLGLLFVNGRLKEKLGKWKQDTADLLQNEGFTSGESAKYDAISFHYSELHGGGERITSSQKMSEDMLYVIDSPFSPLSSFRIAKSLQEREWKKVLDQNVSNRLNKSLEKATRTQGINTANYIAIPLNEIRKYEDQPLPGFSQRETADIIGRLWEGIYKNYFLGIKKSDGTVVDPLDSTLPLILLSKDKTHLLLVTQMKDGESIILTQRIPNNV
jgi:hypothetical protein